MIEFLGTIAAAGVMFGAAYLAKDQATWLLVSGFMVYGACVPGTLAWFHRREKRKQLAKASKGTNSGAETALRYYSALPDSQGVVRVKAALLIDAADRIAALREGIEYVLEDEANDMPRATSSCRSYIRSILNHGERQ